MPEAPALDQAALNAAREFAAMARSRYAVAEAWLYGSHARGTAHSESDVDVALVLDGPRDEVREIGNVLAGDAMSILLERGYYVMPFTVPLEAWRVPETFSNPFLIRNIKRDGIRL